MRILQLLTIVAVVSGSVPDSLAQDVGSFKTLYSFTGQPDGANPSASVVIGGGVLYGTTQYGGTGRCTYISLGCGTVFSLTPPTSPGGAWTESVLHDFKGKCCQASEDGDNPVAPVVIGSGGVLYGTTQYGGTGSCPAFGPCGTAYSLTPPNSPGGTWAEAVYSFPGGGGGFPEAGLVIGGRGVLYGTTSGGGTLTSEYGTVFSLTPPASPGGPWTETTLWSFSGGSDGAVPEAGLVIGKDGILYGTTSIGGVEVVRDPC
ncbi:MAG TPA: choice-of-anchor tandem repeat GloVer-containing protein [Bryobacteraceae bacterium]|nr:choice-of-anchor tandem repeat GloVer-containing protein [Bryobacteraceae bacterium]